MKNKLTHLVGLTALGCALAVACGGDDDDGPILGSGGSAGGVAKGGGAGTGGTSTNGGSSSGGGANLGGSANGGATVSGGNNGTSGGSVGSGGTEPQAGAPSDAGAPSAGAGGSSGGTPSTGGVTGSAGEWTAGGTGGADSSTAGAGGDAPVAGSGAGGETSVGGVCPTAPPLQNARCDAGFSPTVTTDDFGLNDTCAYASGVCTCIDPGTADGRLRWNCPSTSGEGGAGGGGAGGNSEECPDTAPTNAAACSGLDNALTCVYAAQTCVCDNGPAQGDSVWSCPP